ncbi:MAG: type II toxin-antitoxin system Phd/YefM family antitoxin [Thermoanaerobacteraceae bacterium]|uniref:Antitoxin n=1 Tax=Desulfofundulus thermobenzoicus TaxID=29376 RepID=A0A6N7IPR6_9FIRM|nr:type II toxin-antitoxin system Phd/YefM family antitoxin [Desulfofundulus thermobenzoicus]MBE3588702.1 type II toxin-antitoxin system Phd/YefM family antitoxin [Thermoanaerobacteraceae bacterium]MQL51569.1 type II toxin-antitoxin system prevent-host-death family antitoxin [Desulfofundulus thermobenzoicus]HHW42663.1 type II toxin-antitoxin system Phd/YefM family antitoxin [Desulfotomaculum sp.]
MRMVNVTDVRVNIREILSEIAKTKEPVVILQRSRPAAYLVDPETFEKMQRPDETDLLTKGRKDSLDRILQLRAKVTKKAQSDSTPLIREMREGLGRHE